MCSDFLLCVCKMCAYGMGAYSIVLHGRSTFEQSKKYQYIHTCVCPSANFFCCCENEQNFRAKRSAVSLQKGGAHILCFVFENTSTVCFKRFLVRERVMFCCEFFSTPPSPTPLPLFFCFYAGVGRLGDFFFFRNSEHSPLVTISRIFCFLFSCFFPAATSVGRLQGKQKKVALPMVFCSFCSLFSVVLLLFILLPQEFLRCSKIR